MCQLCIQEAPVHQLWSHARPHTRRLATAGLFSNRPHKGGQNLEVHGRNFRERFCIQHNFSEVHPSWPCVSVNASSSALSVKSHTWCVSLLLGGASGGLVWGCRHKAAISAGHSVCTGQSSLSGPTLRSCPSPCSQTLSQAAMLLWAEGRPPALSRPEPRAD